MKNKKVTLWIARIRPVGGRPIEWIPHIMLIKAPEDFIFSERYPEKVTFIARLRCPSDYYGPQCQKLCKTYDDNVLGHSTCDSDGYRLCLPGWHGLDCNAPICSPGCSPSHGTCKQPNECICRFGYHGQGCKTPICHPECYQAKCYKPFGCDCQNQMVSYNLRKIVIANCNTFVTIYREESRAMSR